MRLTKSTKTQIRALNVGDGDVKKAIGELRDAIPDFTVLDGIRQIDGIALTAGTQLPVVHGLGRKYRGFLVSRKSAAADITDDAQAAELKKYIYLTASADSTISILVF